MGNARTDSETTMVMADRLSDRWRERAEQCVGDGIEDRPLRSTTEMARADPTNRRHSHSAESFGELLGRAAPTQASG